MKKWIALALVLLLIPALVWGWGTVIISGSSSSSGGPDQYYYNDGATTEPTYAGYLYISGAATASGDKITFDQGGTVTKVSCKINSYGTGRNLKIEILDSSGNCLWYQRGIAAPASGWVSDITVSPGISVSNGITLYILISDDSSGNVKYYSEDVNGYYSTVIDYATDNCEDDSSLTSYAEGLAVRVYVD